MYPFELESTDAKRTRYLNAQNTFNELLSMHVVPIVNENDTVSVSVSCTDPSDQI